jgi:flagellar hook protein FlgE
MPSRFIVPKDGRCPHVGSNQSGKIALGKAGGGRIGRLEGGKMEE